MNLTVSKYLELVQAIHVAHAIHSEIDSVDPAWRRLEGHLVEAIYEASNMAAAMGHTGEEIDEASLVVEEK